MNKEGILAEELAPLILEVISSGGSFRLFPKGKSMLPFIRERSHSVELVLPENLKKYDIVFYKRPNGQYVIHRIIKLRGQEVVLCGDNQIALEEGIKAEDIIAKVKGIYKKEKYISVDNPIYKAEVLFWIFSRPFRRIYRSIKAKLKKHLIFKKK